MNVCIKPIISHFLIFCIFFPGACCPSGVWEDNYGNIYSLASIPSRNFLFAPVGTFGTVDITATDCGTWEVRPLNEFDPPPLPATTIVWIAENPEPNPMDGCCYAIRFEGWSANGLQCTRITGMFNNVGGKCTQAGNMFLDVMPF